MFGIFKRLKKLENNQRMIAHFIENKKYFFQKYGLEIKQLYNQEQDIVYVIQYDGIDQVIYLSDIEYWKNKVETEYIKLPEHYIIHRDRTKPVKIYLLKDTNGNYGDYVVDGKPYYIVNSFGSRNQLKIYINENFNLISK